MENRPALMADCNIVTFKNGHKTGVRVTHPESGASGVSVYHGNEFKNRMEAYKKMRKTPEYRQWFQKQQAPNKE